MRAFVLGGGGSLGAMQVGALIAMFERGIYPDMLIGCSVGALNATVMARDYSWKNLEALMALWNQVRGRDIYPGGKLNFAWRVLTRQEALVDNRNLYRYLVKSGLEPSLRFGDIRDVPLFVTATNLSTGQLHLFGESHDDTVLDALMASSAQPPYLAPWEVKGTRYIDGGAVTPLPLRVALEQGATEIYALRIENQPKDGQAIVQPTVRGMKNVVHRSISMMIQQQAEYDLYLARQWPNVQLHQIELTNTEVSRNDFTASSTLIQQGYDAAMAHLDNQPRHRREVPRSIVVEEPERAIFPVTFANRQSELYAAAD